MRKLGFAILLLLVGCSQQSNKSSEVMPQSSPDQARTTGSTTVPQALSGVSPAATAARMIIRQATITLIVDDAGESLRRIVALVTSRGGYVAETRQWRENNQIRAKAILRIPADALDEVLPEIHKGAIRVESESVTGQDVSEEYSDLSAQLRNLQATETELRELLATVRRRTQKAADVLEVYNELTKVRGEIERIQGRMKYLAQLTAMSTIQLELIPDVLAKPVVEPGWRPIAVVKNSSRALVNALKWLTEAGIWVVVFLVPLGVLGLGAVFLLRLVWNRLQPLRTRIAHRMRKPAG